MEEPLKKGEEQMKLKKMMVMSIAALAIAMPAAHAQAPVIASFGSNGELVCTNLQAYSTSIVEWASSVTGPWTNSWNALAAVRSDYKGMIRVSVPMFYRVRGVAGPTNWPASQGMAYIPAGPFTMGDTLDGTYDALPLHTNQISAFYIDVGEVTKALWDEVRLWANTNGYDLGSVGDGKAPDHPVHSVNWYDAVKWCNARSEKEGLVPAYYTSAGQTNVYRTGYVGVANEWVKWNAGYRLPTEAEWEKAARGGVSGQRFPWGNTITHSRANYNSSSAYSYDTSPTRGYHPSYAVGSYPYTSPVGSFATNGYGLYDMAGNMSEWCWDLYTAYTSAQGTDPHGGTNYYSSRVMRGGSWTSPASGCTVALRINTGYTSDRNVTRGFRVVLAPIE